MTRAIANTKSASIAWLIALGWLLIAPPARAQDEGPSADDDPLGLDDESSESSEAAAEPEPDSEREAKSEPAASERTRSDPPPNPDLEPEPDEGPSSNGAKQGNRVRVIAALGGGIGTRSYVRPAKTGPQRLPDSAFPAVDLGLYVQLAPASALSWEVLIQYQSSLAFQAHEQPHFALPDDVDVRAERAEFSVAPRLRLGEDSHAPALAFALGFGVRSFWPDIDESITPAYSLLGPQLRVDLVLPITPAFRLRVGPEAQWIVGIDAALQDVGVAAQGGAVGGEARLQLELGPVFLVELAYRESHAFASTTRGDTLFEDVERFATARLGGRL